MKEKIMSAITLMLVLLSSTACSAEQPTSSTTTVPTETTATVTATPVEQSYRILQNIPAGDKNPFSLVVTESMSGTSNDVFIVENIPTSLKQFDPKAYVSQMLVENIAPGEYMEAFGTFYWKTSDKELWAIKWCEPSKPYLVHNAETSEVSSKSTATATTTATEETNPNEFGLKMQAKGNLALVCSNNRTLCLVDDSTDELVKILSGNDFVYKCIRYGRYVYWINPQREVWTVEWANIDANPILVDTIE